MAFRDELGMCLRGAYLTMHRRFQAHFAALGVTADQFVVLSLLAEEDGVIQKDLVQRTWSDANTMAALLALLEKSGWIRRSAAEHDRRARVVQLTPAGRRLQKRLALSAQHLHEHLLASVPVRRRAELQRLLLGIAEAMSPRGTVDSPATSSTS